MALITVAEYARRIGKIHQNVLQKIYRGNLPAKKVGGTWLIEEDEPYIDGRTKGHNYLSNAKREERGMHQRWVLFFKRDGKMYTEVSIGVRKDIEEALDLTGRSLFHILKYEDVAKVAKADEKEVQDWIYQYKAKTTQQKRKGVAEYLKDSENFKKINFQFVEYDKDRKTND